MTRAVRKHASFWQSAGMADAMLLLVAMVWGSSYGVAKEALVAYPVVGFLGVRFGITFVMLLPSWRNFTREKVRVTLQVGIPLGLILLCIFLCETYGVSLTLASNAAFLISTCVVFTPFVEWVVLGRRPDSSAFVATVISLLGAFLLTATVKLSLALGDLLMLIAAVLRAAMVTYTKKLVGDRKTEALPLTAVQAGTVGVGCLILSPFILPGGLPPLPTQASFWWATVYLVVFCTIFAFFAQNYALSKTSPTRVSLLMGSEPVFGALFAVVWLGEHLTPIAWLGGLLIVGSSLWAAMKPLKEGILVRQDAG